MGLRNSLEDILAIQELTGKFATSAQNLRQQAGQEALGQQLPGLLKQGEFGQIGSLAQEAGDPVLYRQIVEQQQKAAMAAAKPAEQPLTSMQVDQFAPPGTTAAQKQAVLDLKNRADQLKVLGREESSFQSGLNRGAGFTKQRIGFEEGNVKAAGTDIRAAIKPFQEEKNKLDVASTLLSAPVDPVTGKRKIEAPAWNSAIRSLAKWASGAGSLSDTDVAGIQGGETLFGNLQEAQNYFKGTTAANATKEQQDAMIGLVTKALENNQQARIDALREAASSAIEQGEKDMFDKDGKLKPVVAGFLYRNGLEYRGYTPEKGAEIVQVDSKKKSTYSIPNGKGSVESDPEANKQMKSIESEVEKVKAKFPSAEAALKSMKENGASPEAYARFLEKLRKAQ